MNDEPRIKEAGLDVTQSHPLDRTHFGRPIPDLISYARVTGRWGLLAHAHNAVK